MPEYRRWTTWVTWSKIAWPYAQNLLSNEIYVYTSAVAMNALFSFTPFVILMISISRYFLPNSGMDTQIYDTLEHYLPFTHAATPPHNSSDLEFVMRNLKAISGSVGKAQLVSTIVLIWSVASVFIPLEMTLNHALGVRESRGFWRSQWLAVRMVLLLGGVAFLFVFGAVSTRHVVEYVIPTTWTLTTYVLNVINTKLWMVPLLLITSCIVLYAAPNTRVPFRDVWPAAILTGLLWEISNYIFILALPFMGLYSLFGPFTIAIAWMTWAYVGGLILVLGANLMAKQVLTPHVEKMKETLWIFRTKSPS
jgi:membrane protein